jgi:hypothetical protein
VIWQWGNGLLRLQISAKCQRQSNDMKKKSKLPQSRARRIDDIIDEPSIRSHHGVCEAIAVHRRLGLNVLWRVCVKVREGCEEIRIKN